MTSETEKFNDRVFGTAWLGIGLLVLWMGLYVVMNLPQQHFGDIAYFIALFFVLFGSNQVRKGRELRDRCPLIVVLSNIFIALSFILYVGCLIWYKVNFERLVETQANIANLMYIIITAFVSLTIGILLNFTPFKGGKPTNTTTKKKK